MAYPAGATADAFTLFERLESQLEAHPGNPYINSTTIMHIAHAAMTLRHTLHSLVC